MLSNMNKERLWTYKGLYIPGCAVSSVTAPVSALITLIIMSAFIQTAVRLFPEENKR